MNIEPLEPRIAPASLAFTDVDGDSVKITVSGAGTLTEGVNVIIANGQLQFLNLTDPAFQNARVSIVATRDPETGGDGHVNVGLIEASGRDLGAVMVDGDLGLFLAGSGTNPARGAASLTVASLGQMGTTTGAPFLGVLVDGKLGTLRVAGDVNAVSIQCGTLGTANIGGSLFGGSADGTGLLSTTGDMGKVKVGGDLVGGRGNGSGTIRSGGELAGVTVGGSLLGGRHPGAGSTDFTSGAIVAAGKLGPVKIAHDVQGNFGEYSGAIYSGTQIISVTIGGSLLGEDKLNSGSITTPGLCGPVTIKGDMVGSFGANSGSIVATQDIASVNVGGSLLGGRGSSAGGIVSLMGTLGPVKIAGNMEGGTATFTGRLFGKVRIVSVALGGSLIGGAMADSGKIHSDGAIGPVNIGHNILGGDGARSGSLDAGTTLGTVTIGGSLVGGDDDPQSGNIHSGGAMGFVKIGRDILAGSGSGSARVSSGGTLAGITLGGSLDGDAFRHGSGGASSEAGQILSAGAMGSVKIGGDVLGGIVSSTGRIVSMSTIASVSIGGSLIGGNSSFSGAILGTGAIGPIKIAGDIVGGDSSFLLSPKSGYIEGQRIASLFVGGSIRAGVDQSPGRLTDSGAVRAVNDIGPITIKGSLLGKADSDGDSSDGDFTAAVISARGKGDIGFNVKNDVAIKSIKIGGSVEFAQILAGYDPAAIARNADAQIGQITIGGDLIASSIIAGVSTPEPFFGAGTDAKASGAGVKDSLDANGAVSRLAGIVIRGSVYGTASPSDTITFAIAAQHLGSLKVGGTTIPLTSGPSNDLFAQDRLLGATRGITVDSFDFHAFEVP